jgi:hypothetical protein
VVPPSTLETDVAVPRVRRKNVLGFRLACEETWGKRGLDRAVALLPAPIREATAGLMPIDEWIPEEFIVAWAQATWEGPAQRNETEYRAFVSLTIKHGFGRVKKLLLRMMAPAQIAPRAPELWRGEHTTGSLDVEVLGPNHMRARLNDHPYVETPLLRLAVAEAFRAVVALTRAANVVETHPPRGAPLLITLRWDDP